MPMLEIGEHSAYISKYTYAADKFANCTANIEDPVNLFFYDMGYTLNVEKKLYSMGWEESPWQEDHQCAYTSNTRPGPNGIGDLRIDYKQVIKGYGNWGSLWERDHMRMWEGGYSTGTEGWWSIGAAHHEKADVEQLTHCLIPFDPNGSSFDLAEYHVWHDALNFYPHYFSNFQNAKKPDGSSWSSCGNTVNHDGIGVMVDLPSDMLNPGEGLWPGQHRFSQDLRFELIYQTDGNLVLYQQGVPIWNTQTITSAGYAGMQTDGNFVIYWPSWVPYWATNTYGNPGSHLVVQNDGNVVIYRSNGTPMWWTGTCCR